MTSDLRDHDASIDAVSGVFTWTPTDAQSPEDYRFDVVVTDNGIPGLRDRGNIVSCKIGCWAPWR